MKPSTADYSQARKQELQGDAANLMDKAKATAYDVKAGVKETFGADATADRAEAERLRVAGTVQELKHDAQAQAHDVKGKVEQKLGQ